ADHYNSEVVNNRTQNVYFKGRCRLTANCTAEAESSWLLCVGLRTSRWRSTKAVRFTPNLFEQPPKESAQRYHSAPNHSAPTSSGRSLAAIVSGSRLSWAWHGLAGSSCRPSAA